jgi:hypothetical protein
VHVIQNAFYPTLLSMKNHLFNVFLSLLLGKLFIKQALPENWPSQQRIKFQWKFTSKYECMPKQNLNSYLVISKATQHLMGGRTLFALGFFKKWKNGSSKMHQKYLFKRSMKEACLVLGTLLATQTRLESLHRLKRPAFK